MQQGVVRRSHADDRRRELMLAQVDSTILVTVAQLKEADFCGCIAKGEVPCRYAAGIHKNVDPSATTLDCREHLRHMTIEEALGCKHTNIDIE